MSKLVMQQSFRAVGQKAAEWQTFEKPKNKRQMHGLVGVAVRLGWTDCRTFVSYFWVFEMSAIPPFNLC